MSTRAQIRIIGENGKTVDLYRHGGGGFDAVMEMLRKASCDCDNDINTFATSLVTDGGCEITFYLHFDIEYFYLLDFSKKRFRGWETKKEYDDKFGLYSPWVDGQEMPLTYGSGTNLYGCVIQ